MDSDPKQYLNTGTNFRLLEATGRRLLGAASITIARAKVGAN